MNAEQHIVLLVDDEPLVLRALSRALRREAYQILLANSGAEGLALLARHPVDVVVSDMRMPNMDGVTFLRQVREQCPQVARIILTGYAEREMIRRAFEQGDTIEVLNKPWDDEQLKRILRELLEQQEQGGEGALGLHAIISRSGQLPVVPQAYREIRALMEASQEPSLEAIAQAIMREPAITAKILQIANSTFFGQRRRVGTVERAVMVMGLELVRDLVLASSLFSALQTKSCEGFEHQALWRHSMACGLFALRLAQQYGLAAQVQSAAMVTGILHDIGKLVLVKAIPRQYAEVVKAVREGPTYFSAVEDAQLGTNHAEVGGYLADWWNLPSEMAVAIRWHCQPESGPNPSLLTALIHLADLLTYQHGQQACPSAPPPPPSSAVFAVLNLTPEEFARFSAELGQLLATGELVT